MAERFAMAAGHPLTLEAGTEVLAAGGTAVDAVVAGAFTAMVAEPVLAGLLGGGFLMRRTPEGRVRFLDMFVDTPGRARPAREADLRAVTADFGGVTQGFHIGAATIAVPGLAAGLVEAHEAEGRLPFADLLQPAIRAAREGVRISALQARLGRIVAPIVSATPEARALNCDAEGLPLGEGALQRNPDFADVLEVMGHEGVDFIRRGEVAEGLLALARDGGHLERADLARWRAVARAPLEVRRGDATIALNPPPALGGALTAFPLALLRPGTGPGPSEAEIMRAFARTVEARAESGIDHDPAAGAAWLARSETVERFRSMAAVPAGRPVARRGTTHLSAIDAAGGAAALTLSNGEGCGLIVPGTGIMPNNMLGEEDLVPGLAEDRPFDWAPATRLASMMAPLVAARSDGAFWVLGSGGSNRIRTALAQVLLRLLDRGEAMGDAVTAPRLHVEGAGAAAVLDYELPGLGREAEGALLSAWADLKGSPLPERDDREAWAALGARAWDAPSMFFGGVHGAMREARGGLRAAGDPRRAGVAQVG
ncbi:MAG: gamma-glutamyltransferase [Pseudomonadota bacterium]